MPKTGKFNDPHVYLDCVFRLMREDAIRTLREGLKDFKKKSSNKNQNQKALAKIAKESRIRLYENVEIRGIEALDYQGCLAFLLRISDKSVNYDWVQSKKLLPGSLFIISPDNFKTFYVGIVKLRDQLKMQNTVKKFKYVEIHAELLLESGSMDEFLFIMQP